MAENRMVLHIEEMLQEGRRKTVSSYFTISKKMAYDSGDYHESHRRQSLSHQVKKL
jgi:hypothetical protein